MLSCVNFEEQKHLDSEEGKLIPDMTINLPEGKNIVVDSKVPLDAYMKVFETEDEAQQKILMAQHAQAVKGHLRKLSAKNYWSQFKQSPDYVILYMQIESSFAAALQEDPLLIEEGIKNRVIFATPTTLITLLRTVSFVWQQRDITKNIYWIGSGFKVESGEELIGGATNLNEIESVIADSIVLQQFAMLLAIKNGLNPDAPTGLLKVTQTI